MYEIKSARHEDEAFAHKLTRSNMDSYVAQYWGGWDEHIFAANYRQRENLIAWAKSIPVGYVAVTCSGNCLRIEDLQVCPEHQRRGIGAWVIKYVERIAKDRNVSELEVRVFHDNPASRLYRRLGFKPYSNDRNTETLRKTAEPTAAAAASRVQ